MIFFKEGAGGSSSQSQFTDSRSDINVHIREAIQILRDVSQILSKIADMQHNKTRVRMARNYPVSRFDQLGIGRKVAAVE